MLVHEVWGRFTLEQIARFDDLQLWNIVFRRRDENGQLILGEDDLPEEVRLTTDSQGRRFVHGTPVSFKQMFRDVNKHIPEDQQTKIWTDYQVMQAALAANMNRELEEQERLQYQVTQQMEAVSLPKGTILLTDVAKYNR